MAQSSLIGAIAALLGLLSFIPYLIDIARGSTRPHAFSWLVWALLAAIGFAGQVVGGAGAGAWITAAGAMCCTLIFVLSLFRGEPLITKLDVTALVACGFTLLLWYLTSSPLLSVVFVTIIDTIGFVPTLRKSLIKPFEETLSMYVMNAAGYSLALIAIERYSLLTTLYPATLVATSSLFAATVYLQRRKKTIEEN